MANQVKVVTDGNKHIYMEIEEPKGEKRVGVAGKLNEINIQEITETVDIFSSSFFDSISKKDKKQNLKEVSIEFGVSIGVETGGLPKLIIKGSGDVSIKVKIVWSI